MLLKVQPNPEVIEHVSIFSTLLIFLAVSQHLLTCARELFAPKNEEKKEDGDFGEWRGIAEVSLCRYNVSFTELHSELLVFRKGAIPV